MVHPTPLTWAVTPIDCPALTTVEGACEYLLALPKRVAMRTHWQHAVHLCRVARERPSREAVAELTEHLELALALSFRLDASAEKRGSALAITATGTAATHLGSPGRLGRRRAHP
jgi:hypothetical protein